MSDHCSLVIVSTFLPRCLSQFFWVYVPPSRLCSHAHMPRAVGSTSKYFRLCRSLFVLFFFISLSSSTLCVCPFVVFTLPRLPFLVSLFSLCFFYFLFGPFESAVTTATAVRSRMFVLTRDSAIGRIVILALAPGNGTAPPALILCCLAQPFCCVSVKKNEIEKWTDNA